MKKILIISPDPQTNMMLTLAFELDGWKVKTAWSADRALKSGSADLILFDMAEGVDTFDYDDLKKTPSKTRVILIPPRGMDGKDIGLAALKADYIMPRPFDLMHLIRTAGKMVS